LLLIEPRLFFFWHANARKRPDSELR